LGSALALHAAIEVAGQDVIIIAGSAKQARIIYESAAIMVDSNPVLKERFWTRDHIKEIKNKQNRSIIRILSSMPSSADGWNGCAILDEIASWGHSAKQIWEKLQNINRSRWNGYILSFSTANHEMGEHVGYQLFRRAEEVAKNPDLDPLMLPTVYSCPPHLWDREEGWKLANPSWGTLIDPAEFRADYEAVKTDLRQQRRFKMFSLNIFQAGSETYIPPEVYEKAVQPFDEKDLHGRFAHASLDLSRRRDLTVWLLLIEKDGKLHLLPRIFTPEATLDQKTADDKQPYRDWVRDGYVIATPGDTIQQEDLIPQILQDDKDFYIHSCRYDPWNADLLAQELRNVHGIDMQEMRCNSGNSMVIPTVELERAFQRGEIIVPDNPCLRWCFENAVLRRIGADGILIAKSKCTARVDAAVAAVLSMSGYLAAKDAGYADASWISSA
jgi:phage terminase large subunit-like protein